MSDFEISEQKLRASPEFFIFFYKIFFCCCQYHKRHQKKWLRARTGKKVPYSRPLDITFQFIFKVTKIQISFEITYLIFFEFLFIIVLLILKLNDIE